MSRMDVFPSGQLSTAKYSLESFDWFEAMCYFKTSVSHVRCLPVAMGTLAIKFQH